MPFLLKESLIKNRSWLDYSSLENFMSCPRWYYWRSVRGLSTGSSAALIAGKAIHEAIATYHTTLRDGGNHDEALAKALDVLPPIMAEVKDDDPKRNLSVVRERLETYFNHWRNSTDQTLEVEIGFAVDLTTGWVCLKCNHATDTASTGGKCPNCDEDLVENAPVFVGKIDRVVRTEFGVLINETKSTTIVGNRWHLRVKPNLQTDGYCRAWQIMTGERPAGARLDVIPLHEKPTSKHEPFRYIGIKTEDDLDAWEHDIRLWYKFILTCMASGEWPRNTNRCYPLTGYSCPYPTLCEMYPKTPHGEITIPEQYTYDPWVPWDGLV